MKYFLDTEFIEGFHKPLFGKRRHFIDLISIGIVCEDGRSYYAVSNEFSPKDADDWVRKNVIKQLPPRFANTTDPSIRPSDKRNQFLWKTNNHIKQDLLDFFGCVVENDYRLRWVTNQEIEIYGYYADYDWVLFCSLFGRMINLPVGFPMYCRDLKQMLDEKSVSSGVELHNIKDSEDYPRQGNEHNALDDAIWNYKLYNFITQP